MTNNILPLISIITATYNSQAYLEQTIQSVLNQTYPNIEYIVIDGASTDNTLQIIEKYRYKISRVISEPDKGIYDAFNKGAKIASGDIISFLNSDDYLFNNDVIHEIAEIFIRYPALAFVYSNVIVFDEKCNFRYNRGRKMTFPDLKTGEMPPHTGFFCRKTILEKHEYFDTQYKIAADFDFIIKCFQSDEQNSLYYDKTTAVFRYGGISTDYNKQQLMNKEQNIIIKKYFNSETDISGNYNGHYRIWLEHLLLQGKGITNVLHQYSIKNIAIFGTMKTAYYLMEDAKREGLNTVVFLDNNSNMQHQIIFDIPIDSPEWLLLNNDKVDAILISIESNRDIEVRNQLEELIKEQSIPIYSWKELIKSNLE